VTWKITGWHGAGASAIRTVRCPVPSLILLFMRPMATTRLRLLARGMRRVGPVALAAAVVFGCSACSGSTGPTFSLAGAWQGESFFLVDVQQSGGSVRGTMEIPPSVGGINTGTGNSETIKSPMTGHVSGSTVELQIDSFGDVPASRWSGHFRDASTVLGAWTIGDQSHPDSLVKTLVAP
jgi:hypothetical protein